MKKRLIIDMDGVLADVYKQFIALEEKESGIKVPVETLKGKEEYQAFKNGRKHVNSKGFFRHAPLMNGCVEVMKKLNENFDVFIVSAAMEFPGSLPEKHDWLKEHFPFITWQQIVFCGSKTVIKGDIMIDDHYKNLDNFTGQTILFTQPHNDGHDDRGHKRVHTWKDISNTLL
ncbi:MAG: 5'(3')-deoxyribonucleotidase [Bacteroidota bacterium]